MYDGFSKYMYNIVDGDMLWGEYFWNSGVFFCSCVSDVGDV